MHEKHFQKNQPLDAEMLENVRRRFAKEVRIQGGLNHPNILPILHSELGQDPPYYLMPVAECSLADDLAHSKSLSGSFISAISDIMAGLEEIHSVEIYHRDLKPQNVLRLVHTTDLSKFYYVISDFGLLSMRDSRLSNLTATGMQKGSDYYAAPEITRNLKLASAQSDIYSLGCILHDMAGSEDRIPCGEIREPGDFEAIFLGCTRKDPAQRFRSARAVLDAILSIDLTPSSSPLGSETNSFIDALTTGSSITGDFWSRLSDFLLSTQSENDESAIFRKLNSALIETLCDTDFRSGNSIAVQFAKWVSEGNFDFDYCDALANRLEDFYRLTAFEGKAECLCAMLMMGTSHNRWFVERKFVSLTDAQMDDKLAKRLAIQFRVIGDRICPTVSHLERSISFNRSSFHPAIQKALSDVCG